MAEPLTPDSISEGLAPVTEPMKPRPPRRRHVQIDVPPWQADWPLEAQTKCYFQRQELKQAQAVIKRQNALIKHLRHMVRQNERVWRLKTEARIEGLTQGIDRALAQHPHNGVIDVPEARAQQEP